MTSLNGWTPERLYDLKQKVDTTYDKLTEMEVHFDKRLGRIEQTLKRHESEETQTLREQVKELQERPQKQVVAFVVPILCACIPAIPALILLLNH